MKKELQVFMAIFILSAISAFGGVTIHQARDNQKQLEFLRRDLGAQLDDLHRDVRQLSAQKNSAPEGRGEQ